MKIISLLPSATEIVCALGAGDDLAGVTFECDYPADAASKPIISESALPADQPLDPGEIDAAVRERMSEEQPLYHLNERLINEIQPDVIITQDLCRVCAVPTGQVQDALDKLGCTSEVVSLDPQDLGEVIDSIGVVAKVLGAEAEAERLSGGLRERIEAVRSVAKGLPSVRSLALEWSDPPWIGGHWIPEMVRLAGGENLLGGQPGERSRTVTWTQIAAEAPEMLLFMPCGYYLEEAQTEGEKLFDLLAFADTPAAREGNAFAVDATSYFSRPGPRLVDGLEILAWAIHPEAFPEPAEGRIARLARPGE